MCCAIGLSCHGDMLQRVGSLQNGYGQMRRYFSNGGKNGSAGYGKEQYHQNLPRFPVLLYNDVLLTLRPDFGRGNIAASQPLHVKSSTQSIYTRRNKESHTHIYAYISINIMQISCKEDLHSTCIPACDGKNNAGNETQTYTHGYTHIL